MLPGDLVPSAGAMQMSVTAPQSPRSSTTSDVRIAILSADRGGHLQALLEDPVVGQWVALVVADRPDAFAIRHAEWHGVSAVVLRAGKSNLDLYDLALVRVLEEHSIDYVVVAGFPRIVGTQTVHAYPDRIVKVHHSLLPEFPGPDPVADALEHGVKHTGVTVHLISRELEVGPIVSQQALEILDGETWHSLVERIHQLELQMLPAAVRTLVEGRRS
jgi:phosphoribosylglycinamide formyltransferase 1